MHQPKTGLNFPILDLDGEKGRGKYAVANGDGVRHGQGTPLHS